MVAESAIKLICNDLKYEDMIDFLSRFNNRSIYTNNDDSKDYLIKIQMHLKYHNQLILQLKETVMETF